MAKRSEIYAKFELYYERVRTQLKVRMKDLRSDNALQLTALGQICQRKYGMEYSLCVKHTPEQNGVAETMI